MGQEGLANSSYDPDFTRRIGATKPATIAYDVSTLPPDRLPELRDGAGCHHEGPCMTLCSPSPRHRASMRRGRLERRKHSGQASVNLLHFLQNPVGKAGLHGHFCYLWTRPYEHVGVVSLQVSICSMTDEKHLLVTGVAFEAVDKVIKGLLIGLRFDLGE